MEARAGIVNWNKSFIGVVSIALFGGIGVFGNYRFSVWYVVDYCVWSMASLESDSLILFVTFNFGLDFFDEVVR